MDRVIPSGKTARTTLTISEYIHTDVKIVN